MPVNGPYPHRGRWRLVITGAFAGSESGQRAISFDSREECERQIRLARKREQTSEGITAEAVVVRFLNWQRTRRSNPVSEKTAETNGHRLRSLLRLPTVKHATRQDYPIAEVDLGEAKRLYDKRVEESRGDTHLAELSLARQMWGWAVDEKLVKRNPWTDVEPVGRRKRGAKPQLRMNEARHLVDFALLEGSTSGLAVATALILGLRSTEVVSRLVRDLDDNGRLLWVPEAKTPTGVRTMEVPDDFGLRYRLLAQCTGRENTAPLFGLNERGKPLDRHWLHHHLERLCKACKVSDVTVHSLRGLHSTIASVHETSTVVAAALGHTSPAVTKRHYIAPGTEEQISADRVSRRLTQK